MFKILAGEMEPDEGDYKWGLTTKVSYFPKDNTKDFSGSENITEKDALINLKASANTKMKTVGIL